MFPVGMKLPGFRTGRTLVGAGIIALLVASFATAGENCAQMHGVCRNSCGAGEEAASGAFEDCGEKQECCLEQDAAKSRIICCILSFDAKSYGPLNCGLPADGACAKGSASPVPCDKLAACKKP